MFFTLFKKLQNNYTEQIKKKLETNFWGKNNPLSRAEIINFLENNVQIFNGLSGYIQVLKLISRDLEDVNSIKWLNYFSQIRCAYFLKSNNVEITAFEKRYGNKVIDFELLNSTLCEVKSFNTTLEEPDNAKQVEEYVLKDFLVNKIIPAIDQQGSDLLIVDDIFSDNSRNYKFLNYFLSFINKKETERYAIIQKMMGKYLGRILILSFVKSMTMNPTVRYIGNEWKKILKTK